MLKKVVLVTILLLTALGVEARTEDIATVLTGKVVDKNNAAIAGARVTAVRIGTSVGTETTTNAEGNFTLELASAEYEVTVSAVGFEVSRRTFDLRAGAKQTGSVTLQVLPATASVTVSDEAAYVAGETRTATKLFTPLRDIPQAISVVKREQIEDQSMSSMAEVVRYVPGIATHQGENNRDEVIIRGNRSSADFYRDGVRDDVQYYRDLYNVDRVEALKGPNAMVFGRGGGGGVINRVMKEARFMPAREFSVTGGSWRDRRLTGDIGQAIGTKAAFRVNGVYERSDSFRKFVGLEREGINPTFTFTPDSKTSIRIGYEYFRDRRTADRGITSYLGRVADVPVSTYYGDADQTYVRVDVHAVTGTLERLFGDLVVRNHFSLNGYDRGYQNFVPGAVSGTGTLVTLTAYNNATNRTNLFDQTDLTHSFRTGIIRHTVVGGTELGRQVSDNRRNTGYFNNTATSIQVAFDDPITKLPVTFRQSATDADNHLTLNLGAAFVQDQIEVTKYFQAIVGVRYDHFGLTYLNNRNGQVLERVDGLVNPRLGFVVKPVTSLSLYTSYSVSQLPSSGDQFSSLTTVTEQVKPERFTNIEGGVKWGPASRLDLTAAVYRLDRTNTRATDPGDPTRILQTGSQRTTGVEAGLNGKVTSRWSLSGGYTWQNAQITRATTAAPAGRQVALVPHNMFSLWNKYQVTNRFGTGLGLSYRSDVFAAIDNTVALPAYLKADVAVYYTLGEHWRLQANLENLTNKRFYVNADSNTNISPGSPRAIKIGLIARF